MAVYILFGAAWLAGMAYGLSAVGLLVRIRALTAEGRLTGAPDPMTNPLDVIAFIVWLVGGRYGEIDDDVVRRRAGIARILFLAAAPLILGAFVAFAVGLGSGQLT